MKPIEPMKPIKQMKSLTDPCREPNAYHMAAEAY